MSSRPSAHSPARPHAPYHFPQDPGVQLACPVCRTALAREEHRFVCRGPDCRKAYPIRDAIPLLLESEANTLSPDEWQKVCDA
ncbi:MAG TPA: Trm112 family protein [Caulifigura sp.]|nr:Trm112 family protein [Caulifigura sp.]